MLGAQSALLHLPSPYFICLACIINPILFSLLTNKDAHKETLLQEWPNGIQINVA
jgi:hypothetical protein